MASNIIPPPTPSANLIDVPRTLMFETPHPASANGSHKTVQPENVLSPQAGAKHRTPVRWDLGHSWWRRQKRVGGVRGERKSRGVGGEGEVEEGGGV